MAIRVAAVVVAAGRGTRAGLDYPKQYKVMGGSPMVRESLCVFTSHPEVDLVLPVIHPGRWRALRQPPRKGSTWREPVAGAATRQGSVHAGLEALAAATAPAIVLVHDAARPFTSAALVEPRHRGGGKDRRRDSRASRHRHGEAGRQGRPRRRDARPLASAHRADAAGLRLPCAARRASPRRGAEGREDFPDDAALVEWAGLKVDGIRGRERAT